MTNIFKDRAKFLVQWIEPEGLIRGQMCCKESDAVRLFEHVLSAKNPVLCEIRKVGNLLTRGNKTFYYRNTTNSVDNATEANTND